MVRDNFSAYAHGVANKLSSYAGNDLERAADAMMSGFTADELIMLSGDDLVGFGVINEVFKSQMAAGRIFQLTVTGHATENETFYLNPSNRIAEGDNGHPISGKGIGGYTITFAGAPGGSNAVKQFYRALSKTPMNAVGVKLFSSDATQLQKQIDMTEYLNGPFNQGTTNTIFPQTYIDETSYRTDMITIPQQMSFDYNTDIVCTILATKVITFTIVLGARLDVAAALKNSATKALQDNQGKTQVVYGGNMPQINKLPQQPQPTRIQTTNTLRGNFRQLPPPNRR